MKLPNIPRKAKELWETWDLRSFIILSLCLQAYLILFATKRKRTKSTWWNFTIWFSYLFADWVADIAVGFISKSQMYKCSSDDDSSGNGKLLTFWAPFLLLHLGGPDNITAFALEDNELWVRHLLGVILQFLAAVYVLFKSFPTNKLWFQTFLVLIAGTIKYAERSFALYLASMQRFGESIFRKPDPGPEYAKVLEIYQSMKANNLPTRLIEINSNDVYDTTEFQLTSGTARDREDDLDDKLLMEDGYRFFQTFKGLIVGLHFSSKQRRESKEYFLKRNARDAFRLIEIELSFIYEVLHTKANVVRSWYGFVLRSVCFLSIAVAFLLFYLVEKKGFQNFDVRLTYALFIGAVVMEIITIIKHVFSDWTIIGHDNFLVDGISACIANRKRWSQTVSHYNLVSHSRHDPPRFLKRVFDYFGFERSLDQLEFKLSTKSAEVSPALKHFIFEELKEKSLSANNVKIGAEICEERGAWSLRKNSFYKLYPWCYDIDYVESLIQWHIATELCYSNECFAGNDEDGKTTSCLIWKLLWYMLDIFRKAAKFCHKFITGPCYANNNDEYACNDSFPESELAKIAKLLSDYMLYLLIMQPTMMAPVSGNWQLIFQDTCAEAKRLFQNSSIAEEPKRSCWGKYILFPYRFVINLIKGLFCGSDILEQIKACHEILKVDAVVKPGALKGYLSKSALFDARMLAKELLNISDQQDRWRIVSQVWLELLSYAAVHCKADVHAQQPSKGGELLTLVWLLMNHLGLGKQFYEDGQSQVKFVVGK